MTRPVRAEPGSGPAVTPPARGITVELIVLQHDPAADLAGFEPVLTARATATPWRRVDVPAGEALPSDLDRVAGLIVMGGRMSATDPTVHAWMPAELDLLRRAVDAGVPVLGVCLGAQLLGAAGGGRVTRRVLPRGGYLATARTDAAAGDPVLGGWPEGAATLFIHEDEVSWLPDGSVALLTVDAGPGGDAADTAAPAADTPGREVVAWRSGSAWAVQFHPEVDGATLAAWTADPQLGALLATAGVDPAALAAEGRVRDRFVLAHGRALVGRFLDGPVRARTG
jgi:GMP synthase (glutamine-hydrolysing)